MLLFGFLKLGFLVRFISSATMTGFLSGLGLLTILGQTGDLIGAAIRQAYAAAKEWITDNQE